MLLVQRASGEGVLCCWYRELAVKVYYACGYTCWYRELCECGEEAREMAVQTFTVQKQFYAMVAAKKISKILGLN